MGHQQEERSLMTIFLHALLMLAIIAIIVGLAAVIEIYRSSF
jgi:hypothetical protein